MQTSSTMVEVLRHNIRIISSGTLVSVYQNKMDLISEYNMFSSKLCLFSKGYRV
jgi:hypothetical protein